MGARRLASRSLILLCTLSVSLLLFTVAGESSFAAIYHPFLSSLNGTGTPAKSFPQYNLHGLAVDGSGGGSAGDLYIVDGQTLVDKFSSAPNREFLCQITGAAGSLAAPLSECDFQDSSRPGTVTGSLNSLFSIAVAPSDGHVYVGTSSSTAVDKFSAAGAFESEITGFSSVIALAADRLGNVYIGDTSARVVKKYDASNSTLTTFAEATPAGRLQIQGLAVDNSAGPSAGDVYVSDYQHRVVDKFGPNGEYLSRLTGTPSGSFSGPEAIAVDPSNGDVYVSESVTGAVIDEFDASGTFLGQITSGETPTGLGSANGLAVSAAGEVYVSDASNSIVDVFGPGVVIPDVTTGPASEVEATSATIEGTVNPDGLQLSDCHFDYGTDTYYGLTAPCEPAAASIPADGNTHMVVAKLKGLKAGTTYHYRLVASNADGVRSLGLDGTLSTLPPPSISSATAANVNGNSVELNAVINPNGYDTIYRFEYGQSTAYGTSFPVPDEDIGAGTSDVVVKSWHIAGLSANTTYHWRVIAQSANGTTTSGDHTFVYDTSGSGLPDNRAYEMLTPPQKNGALIGHGFIIVNPDFSEGGSRAIMSAVQCFGGAESCTASRQTEGEQYLFERTSRGWVTTPLAPPATQFEANSSWVVSAETGTELFSMPTPPMGEDDFYVRRPSGSFVDIGPATPPSEGALWGVPWAGDFIGATSDFSHIVYQESPSWSFDASNREFNVGRSLYEYVGVGNAAPVLVAVSGGSGSTDLIGKCGAILGSGENSQYPGTMSADGETLFFTVRACASGTGANAGSPVPAKAVYARIGRERTVKISERSLADCSGACQTSPAADAHFEGASDDGSKAFFTSTQQLTNSASEDGRQADSAFNCTSTVGANGCNLYEYDFVDPAGHNLIDVSAGDTDGYGPRVEGVMAISSDGSHVYFVAKGVLSATANSQGETAREGANNLYVFARDASHPTGRVAFVVTLPDTDQEHWKPVGEANVTPDGRFLVFPSHGRLTPDDTRRDGAQQVFRYDALAGELTRLSIGEHGFNDNGNGSNGEVCVLNYGCPTNAKIVKVVVERAGPARRDPTMSHDGAYVFFESPVGLTPQALNEVQIGTDGTGRPLYAENVYEWHGGQVDLISGGKDTSIYSSEESAVKLLYSDATGANVFFSTSDPLVSQDTDTQLDYYDARICTASDPCVAQPPPPLSPCLGEACHGTPVGTPPAPNVPSVTFSGQGNVIAPTSRTVKKAIKRKTAKCAKAKRPSRARGKRPSHARCMKTPSRKRSAGKATSHKGGK